MRSTGSGAKDAVRAFWRHGLSPVAARTLLGCLPGTGKRPKRKSDESPFRDSWNRIRCPPETDCCVVAVPKKQANPIDAHVGNRMRLRRMLIGLSQERLGELLGLTFQQVQKYEKGVNRIGAGRLYQIADILSVPSAISTKASEETVRRATPRMTTGHQAGHGVPLQRRRSAAHTRLHAHQGR